METAQLSYFILACQFRNHTEAANWSQVPPSTMSENLHALERELGLTLFQRGPHGHYPTETARWLYQVIEPLLQAVTVAKVMVQQPNPVSLRYLDINSPLQFMVGHLARTTSLAIAAVMHSMPGVVARAHFALNRAPYIQATDKEKDNNYCSKKSRVLLNYAANADKPDGVVILRDEWISLSGVTTAIPPGDRPLSFEALRRAPLYVPSLDPGQLAQISHYCRVHALPQPRVIEEDVGTLARLSRDPYPFHMLAPRSLVAASAERSTLRAQRLPVDLAAVIVAHFAKGDQVAACFVEHLRTIIMTDNPIIAYKPAITVRQLRYFLAVSERLNMTATARQLHVAQPALSSQISKLEATLGITLFQRSRKGLIPCQSANLLRDLMRPAMLDCEGITALANDYTACREERLTIGILPVSNHDEPLAQGIAMSIATWAQRYPSVKLRIIEGTADILQSWMESGEVRFAIVANTGQCDQTIGDTLAVISSAQHLIMKAGTITLSEALELPLVLPGPEVELRQQLNNAAVEIAASITPVIEADSQSLILALVKQMPLATIMPESVIRQLGVERKLQVNKIDGPLITYGMSLLCPDSCSLTDKERELMALLDEHLQLKPNQSSEFSRGS